MFEFHGWISINVDDSDEPDIEVLDCRQKELCAEIEKKIETLKLCNRVFHLHQGLNGSSHLVFCGLHNHRDEGIIKFFCEVGFGQPHSYGKLHVRDDEDRRGYGNSMQEWTMARGRVFEETDKLMSPCIPKIEHEL